LILLATANTFGQNKQLTIHILDEQTKDPIQFCFAIVKGKNNSAQSDEHGLIIIPLEANDTLVIYQLGYYIKKIATSDVTKNNNLVLLKSKIITLNEISIKSSKRDTLQANNNVVFLDFDFYDDYILALINKGGKHNSVLILNMNGVSISEKKLSINSETIFKDCFENIHLITKDSSYQIYYNYQHVNLLEPYSISAFNSFLKPCECYNGNNSIFKITHYKKLKNTFILYDNKSQNNKQIIACISDSEAIKGFNMDYDINYFLSQRKSGIDYKTSASEINNHIDQLREQVTLPFDYANLLKPVESEIKKIDSTFILIDYSHQLISTFSTNGKLINTIFLNSLKEMIPKLNIDYDTQNLIFSKLNNKGILILYRFDKNKNKLTHQFELKSFYFIKKIKIKANNLYFINKDKSSSMTKSKIIKELIIWQPL